MLRTSSSERKFIVPGLNYDEIAGMDQPMDPETEDLLFADELQNGMMVLVESVHRHNDIDPRDKSGCQLRKANRWCEVTKLRIGTEMGSNGILRNKTVSFIGRYSDGDLQVRTYGAETGFVVKKDSIPAVEVRSSEEDDLEHAPGDFADEPKPKTVFGSLEVWP